MKSMTKENEPSGSFAGVSVEELMRLLKDNPDNSRLKVIEKPFSHHEFERPFNRDPFENYHIPLLQENPFPELEKKFDFSIKILDDSPEAFRKMIKGIYHGTSLEALDLILQDGVMKTARQLLREGKLVYGELFEDMRKNGYSKPCGPKFMSRRKMVEMGMITPNDPHFYSFGGVDDIFFDSFAGASSYAHKDPTKRAIIGLNKKALEFWGEKFIDTTTSAGSEGLIHEGPISVVMGLAHILVPADRVKEYTEKVEGRYLTRVDALESE
jgi:hypothetical protein